MSALCGVGGGGTSISYFDTVVVVVVVLWCLWIAIRRVRMNRTSD